MDIFIDSTAFHEDPNLRADHWALVREYLRQRECLLIVPEVVFQETTNKFGEKLRDAFRKLKSSIADIDRLCEGRLKAPVVDEALAINDYKDRLRKRLEELGAKMLPFPPIQHKDLVDRDLRRKKPFTLEGKGYRDALIWYSLLEHLKARDHNFVFVTNNSKDFCDAEKKDAIQRHLLADLQAIGFKSAVSVTPHVATFVEDVIKPTLKRADNIKHGLERKELVDLEAFLKEDFDGVFNLLNDVSLTVDIPGINLEEPIGVSSLGDPTDLHILDVLEVGGGEYFVELQATYHVGLFAYLPKSDVYNLPEDSRVSVSDWDHNKHYAEVEVSTELLVTFEMTFDLELNIIVSFSIREARTFDE
jgi:hypothetical protein